MKKYRFIATFLVITMVFAISLPATRTGAETFPAAEKLIAGIYNYTSNENSNIQESDRYIYSDAFFKQSSFLPSANLEVLSSQLAISSASRCGDGIDLYEVDYTDNSKNAREFLISMGFEDVTANKYYSLEREENSAAVIVGHRNIKAYNGKEYTLLAIAPRSARYKAEWVGNFEVGSGNVHQGFKAGRDEILRFVKKYISDNNISGNIKVWISGHSRGSALANDLGGFFAGGGIAYFDGKVSITPEDVYCYTFATPATVKDNVSKSEFLSVEGYRGNDDAAYVNDTPGEAYVYTGGGTLSIHGDDFKGIRNLINYNDLITKLPPVEWNFERFGTDIDVNHENASESAFLEELAKINLYSYNKYLNAGGFHAKTVDITSMSLVNDPEAESLTMDEFWNERFSGLADIANTNADYVSGGYEDTLKALAGIYGLCIPMYGDDIDATEFIIPLILSAIAYADEKLEASGDAENEDEAAAIALEDLIGYFMGKDIDYNTYTGDNLIADFGKLVGDNMDKEISDKIAGVIADAVPEDQPIAIMVVNSVINKYNPNIKSEDELYGNQSINKESLKYFAKALYYGAEEGSLVYKDGEVYASALYARNALYTIINLSLALFTEGAATLPLEEYVIDEDHTVMILTCKVSKVIEALKPIFLTEKQKIEDEDEQQVVIDTYANFAEAADGKMKIAIDKSLAKIVEKCGQINGEYYKNRLLSYMEDLKANVSLLRELLMGIAFEYGDGEFDTVRNIKTLATFAGNINGIPLAHYNELYIAYAKANANATKTAYDIVDGGYTMDEKTREEAIIAVWEATMEAVNNPSSRAVAVEVSMVNQDGSIATVIPSDILEIAKGKNVDVFFNMGEYGWIINGNDINTDNLKDINLQVTFDTDAVPISAIKAAVGDMPSRVISLSHSGDFGFKARLSFNTGNEYIGLYGNLFWYNAGKLEIMDSGLVSESGRVELAFTHASDYVVAFSANSMINSVYTGDSQNLLGFVLTLSMAGAGLITCVVIKKNHLIKAK